MVSCHAVRSSGKPKIPWNREHLDSSQKISCLTQQPVYIAACRILETDVLDYSPMALRRMMFGPFSSYSSLDTKMGWKLERRALYAAPTHAAYFLVGGATTQTTAPWGARAATSLCR